MQWILLLALFLKCNKNEPVISVNDTAHNNAIHSRLTLSDKVGDIVNHPAFKGFGEMLLPREDNSSYYNTSLRNIGYG